MKYGVRKRLVNVSMLTLLLVSGCAQSTKGRSGFCDIYIPIYGADGVPESVQLYIDDNNAAYEELCADRL